MVYGAAAWDREWCSLCQARSVSSFLTESCFLLSESFTKPSRLFVLSTSEYYAHIKGIPILTSLNLHHLPPFAVARENEWLKWHTEVGSPSGHVFYSSHACKKKSLELRKYSILLPFIPPLFSTLLHMWDNILHRIQSEALIQQGFEGRCG